MVSDWVWTFLWFGDRGTVIGEDLFSGETRLMLLSDLFMCDIMAWNLTDGDCLQAAYLMSQLIPGLF